MSFGNRPNPPDPNQVSQAQLKYGTEAAQAQQRTNMFNQTGPYGSQTYTADPNSPSGYAANVSLSPEQAQQAQNIQRAQTGLSSNFSDMYSAPPNFADPNTLMQQQLKLQQAYWNPIFEQQQSNLDARLRNQGLSPGSGNNQAWNNAQNLLARNQGDVTNQFMMQMQPITFQEMMANYQMPLQIANQLKGQLPGMPQFVTTPQAQVQAPNYAQAAQNQYQAQQANYATDQQGMMGMIGTGLSLGLAPFTGGASLMGLGAMGGMGGGGGGMFSGGWG